MKSKSKNNFNNHLLDDDKNLWNALKNSDPEALNKLFKKYYKDLFFYGMKIDGNQNRVMDSIQDVYANLWETRKNISETVHVKAYLLASLRNGLLRPNPKDVLHKPGNTIGLDYNYNFDISPEEIYLDNETQIENLKIIENLLNGLSPKQREIIYLKFYCNYSNIEISEILSIRQQSVANLLTRTLTLLRKTNKNGDLQFFNMLIFFLL